VDRTETIQDVDAYIAQFPAEIQERLQTVRETIRKNAPEASEKISYAMPAFYLNGDLVYYAAFKNHIGFFPTGAGIDAFKDRFCEYAFSKGGVRFPHKSPLPLELIGEIVRYRVGQAENAKPKKEKTPKPAQDR
jgi:uncharacterized protein YdhG (YjbR/CyaY superfamily)